MQEAVAVESVSKTFKVYHQQYRTLKERMIFWRQARAIEEFWAVKDVSFTVEKGRTFGLIGANGSGKSTLLRLVAGILRPSRGAIRVHGRLAALLELGAGFHPDLTGRENVYLNGSILGLSRKEIDRQFSSIVEFAELSGFIDNPVRNYSSGMYVRLGFSVAVHMDPEVLLVDEVLAVGDEPFQKKCLGRIREFQREGRTIIFVTHAVDLVRDMCDEAAFLSHGEVAAIGHPAEVIRQYREQVSRTPTGERINVLNAVDINALRLLDDKQVESEVFVCGRSMALEAELDARESVSDPVFAVNIFDSAGQHIFGTNTHWRHMKVDLDAGPARLRVDFPMLPMREGRFTLTLTIHSRDALTLFAQTDPGKTFEVHSDSDEPGRLYLPCSFSVEGAAVRHGGI